jgi:hypothetical protein
VKVSADPLLLVTPFAVTDSVLPLVSVNRRGFPAALIWG